jgi:hypothetical protein
MPPLFHGLGVSAEYAATCAAKVGRFIVDTQIANQSASPICVALSLLNFPALSQDLAAAAPIFLRRLTEAAEMPASRAASRTPLPADNSCLALSILR